MDNVSILKIILSQINSVLICSIRVSIKSFTFQRTVFIAQSFTFIFDGQFWFSDSSKTWYWQCKILTLKEFFLRNDQPKIFHQDDNLKFPARGAALKERPLFGLSQKKLTESAHKFQLFDLNQNSNMFFSIKKGLCFSNKIHKENSRL